MQLLLRESDIFSLCLPTVNVDQRQGKGAGSCGKCAVVQYFVPLKYEAYITLTRCKSSEQSFRNGTQSAKLQIKDIRSFQEEVF